MMTAYRYRVECLTNLHVGSGETTYSIIDNEVARDPVLDNVPIIPASGVKGALRVHCKANGMSEQALTHIFGHEISTDVKRDDISAGQYKFFSAQLLARPLRVSSGSVSYVLTTTPEILCAADTLAKGVKLTADTLADALPPVGNEPWVTEPAAQKVKEVEGVSVTGFGAPNQALQELLGGAEYAMVASFRDFALPVVARNQLNEGISKNLWYEEIVPYKSIFTLVILVPEGDPHFADFETCLQEHPVQFGGNASVGYGYTKLKRG